MIKPVIVIVTYNRFNSFKRLLESINKAYYPIDDITLIISIDYHPENQKTVNYANSYFWKYGPKIIRTHDRNMGLKAHILECGDYSIQYGSAIVLEDDLVVSEDYYLFTLRSLKKYGNDDHIAGISLYSNEWNNFTQNSFRPLKSPYTVYFRQYCESWGESWSAKQWIGFKKWMNTNPKLTKSYDLPKQIYEWPDTSWGKYFSKYVVEKNKYLVVPYNSRSTCFSEIGQHTSVREIYNQVCLQIGIQKNYLLPEFEKGLHYDIFFENIDISDYLKRWIKSEKCCIDIYASKVIKNSRYVLSTKRLPYKRLYGFALDMRPPEMNIIQNVCGHDIILYDTKIRAKIPEKNIDMDYYDFAGYSLKKKIRQLLLHLIIKIKTNF